MRIIDRQVVWEGRFIRTLLLRVEDANGSLHTWEGVERVGCNGIVVIIPMTPAGELVFIRQFRPILNRYVVEFPAGLNDKGDDLPGAARRELIEETGFAAGTLEVMAEGPVSSGLSAEVTTIYLAKNIAPASEQELKANKPDESEKIEVFVVPMNNAIDWLRQMQDRGDYVDLKVFGFIELVRSREKDTA
ncbi:MAG TPA: NUDIX hydrolase [Dissulfurispiraceae bacterium]|nr:NUDIX hydrolase [Dissulfurispiraceae bacterium]